MDDFMYEELKDCLYYATGEPECECKWCSDDPLVDGVEPF